jgi:hypothetical protein
MLKKIYIKIIIIVLILYYSSIYLSLFCIYNINNNNLTIIENIVTNIKLEKIFQLIILIININ